MAPASDDDTGPHFLDNANPLTCDRLLLQGATLLTVLPLVLFVTRGLTRPLRRGGAGRPPRRPPRTRRDGQRALQSMKDSDIHENLAEMRLDRLAERLTDVACERRADQAGGCRRHSAVGTHTTQPEYELGSTVAATEAFERRSASFSMVHEAA
jgi:hypothetical protein